MMQDISTEGWTKRDGKLFFAGADDVFVAFGDHKSMPFTSYVGDTAQNHSFVEDALDWCERVAAGRELLTGPDPLPTASPIERAKLDRGLVL
jgi:hypothetical protein